jgi:hypothetical protein
VATFNLASGILSTTIKAKGDKMFRNMITKFAIRALVLGILMISWYTVSVCQTKPDTSVVGTWQGTLEAGSTKLHVVFHVGRADDGGLTATLDSPDQSAYGIPFSSAIIEGDSLHFIAPSIGGTYDGKLSAAPSVIIGIWKQGGGAANLKMERSATILQTPAT